LVDTAPRVLPGLDERLSRTADGVLRERGVQIRTGTSVTEGTDDGVRLSDGTLVPTHTFVWCVGVRPESIIAGLGGQTTKGRINVDEYLQVPGQPHVFACGDVAAVPDLTRPGEITPMTAQHAERQGVRAASNIAASYGVGQRRPYKHRDLGFVVDLGGWSGAADPLQIPLAGLPAKVVTRGYHLYSLPGNRGRTAASWLTEAIFRRQAVQLGLIRGRDVPLDTESSFGMTAPASSTR
jgi:NADH dehydrogenase